LIDRLFDELARTDLPAPACARVVARGRQRRRRVRLTMTVFAVAVAVLVSSGAGYVRRAALQLDAGGTPSASTEPGRPLLLGLYRVPEPRPGAYRLAMARLGSTATPVPLRGVAPYAVPEWRGEPVAVTDPLGNRWLVGYPMGDTPGGEGPAVFALVNASGQLFPFGPGLGVGVEAMTGLAVNAAGSAMAVAHVGPGQVVITTAPMPYHVGYQLHDWILASSTLMVHSLSWAPDGKYLTYVAGGRAITIDILAYGRVAPVTSGWPAPMKSGCQLLAGTWQDSTGDYLALERCSSGTRMLAVNYLTGAPEGPATRFPGNCPALVLDPAPTGNEVLVSGSCGLYVYDQGHITEEPDPFSGPVSWNSLRPCARLGASRGHVCRAGHTSRRVINQIAGYVHDAGRPAAIVKSK
jgi:hypothetical protein